MMYLIDHLWPWLLLTAVFASLAGWAYAAMQDAPRQTSTRRQRDGLIDDLGKLAAGDAAEAPRPAVDARQSLADVANGRIAQLERDLELARSRATEAAARIAELQRRLDQRAGETIQPLASTPVEPVTPLLSPPPEPSAPTADESEVLQGWRLRYFEQRVRYLEQRAAEAEHASTPVASPVPAVEAVMAATSPIPDWRVRDAEARAAYLETQLRARAEPAPEPEPASGSPFASNAEVDTLLRWRMLYLQRRLAHTRTQQPAQAAIIQPPATPPAAAADAGPDLDRWKWRARYLEARVRHLTSRVQPPLPATTPPALQPVTQNGGPTPAPPAPSVRRERPPALPGPRNGAPEDLTLIEGVSLLQQTTLNSLGVYHFDQIAAWTPENVAWVDDYLRLRGRIEEEEWVEQADDLAHESAVHLGGDDVKPQPW